jgi:hypothetical protein
MFQKIMSKKMSIIRFLVGIIVAVTFIGSAEAQTYPQYPQQPYYNQQYDPYGQQDDNYSAKSPFKVEIGRLEASVYRPGEEPLPLSQVTRLNQGDVLKVKIANEAVNGIMPHQSNWDWTLLVAFINPSRNNASEETVSEEVRLREKGWYNDNFFTVPYDSQPMIFLYPKPKYRKKILDLISKRPDDIRQMGEKIIEISSAYGHISSFLNQVQYMMANPYYNNGLLEQSIEGMARSFNIQMPSCWRSYGYGYGGYNYGGYSGYNSYSGYNDLASRAQCLSRNIRIEDLNFSVGRMLAQGGLMALSQLKQSHPEISKWIAIAAVAVDFILKLTRKTAIRIIPAVVSTPDNPIYPQGNYYGGGGYYNGGGGYYNGNTTYYNGMNAANSTTYYQGNTGGNSFAQTNPSESNKISLYANYQPNDRDFVTVYAYVPHKWQAEPEPKLTNIYAPSMIEPCFHAGKNLLRNMDLRIEWLSDTFTRDFKLILTDNNGWNKEFALRKNLGLNAFEAEISKDDITALPKNNVFDAKITGKRGFTMIESPIFQIPMANGGNWEASVKAGSNGKNLVTLKRVAGDARCSQNIIYRPSAGQPVIFPITKENSFLKLTEDRNEITFEVDSATPASDSIQIQLYGGEMLNVTIKP